MDEEPSVIELRGISKSFNSTTALKEITFSAKRGEVVGLVGPNGAGKTTAIHIILGLIAPSEGTVRVFGKSPFDDRYEVLKRLNFSSAYTSLPYNLKVIQNLKIYARLYNIPSMKEKIDEVLDLFEISDLRERVSGFLSSGELTRLNLAKSLLNDPELLLLDEPTASLDPDMADKVRQTLSRIHRERKVAILYTSHNMREVEMMCDRIIFIHRGRKITEGKPMEILKRFESGSLEELFVKIARRGDLIDVKERPS